VAIGGLGAALRELGHHVEVHCPGRRTGGTLSRLAFNVGLRRFRSEELDLVVGFDLDGCLLPRLPGVVRIASLKGVMADEARFERGLTRLRFRFLSALEGRNARAADRVIVTSRYSAGWAVSSYGLDARDVEVVPEGIALESWPDPGRPPGGGVGLIILSVARQYRRKDTIALLRALPEVRRALPEARLRVVGGGPMLASLQREARRLGLGAAVEFAGDLHDRTTLRNQYLTADVFALPSLQEGFGIVFLEAMACRLPVVAARAGAAPEVVPGSAGLLVPPSDSEALAAALVELLRDPERREHMGAVGRRHVEAFDWPRVASRFLEAAGLAPVPGSRLAGREPQSAL